MIQHFPGKSTCSSSERTWVTPRFEDSSPSAWQPFFERWWGFYCLHFVDCTDLRPVCRWAVSAKVISWWILRRNMKQAVPHCSNESYQYVIDQVGQKWLKLSERETGLQGDRPSRSSRGGIEGGAFLKKEEGEGEEGGRRRRGKEEKEAAGNLEHLLHPSVTNVKMVPRLKKSWIHTREKESERVCQTRAVGGGQVGGGGQESDKKEVALAIWRWHKTPRISCLLI